PLGLRPPCVISSRRCNKRSLAFNEVEIAAGGGSRADAITVSPTNPSPIPQLDRSRRDRKPARHGKFTCDAEGRRDWLWACTRNGAPVRGLCRELIDARCTTHSQ